MSGPTSASVPIDGALIPSQKIQILIWTILIIAPVIIRRRFPDLAAGLFIAVALAQLLLGPAIMLADAVCLVMVYSCLLYGRPSLRRLYLTLTWVMMSLACLAFTLVNSGFLPPGRTRQDRTFMSPSSLRELTINFLLNFLFDGLLLLVAIIASYWTQTRRDALDEARRRNHALALQAEQSAALSASAERARMARDMHDVVAHTLSIVIVQADAGRYAATADANLALKTMRTIDQEGRRALRELSSLFGKLRAPTNQAADASQKTTNFLPGQHPSSPRRLDQSQATTQTSSTRQFANEHNRNSVDAEGAQPRQASDHPPTIQEAPTVDTGKANVDTTDNAHTWPSAATSSSNPPTSYGSWTDLIDAARLTQPESQFSRHVEGRPQPQRLDRSRAITAYRVLQEALTNVRKHAAPASHVLIEEQWLTDGLSLTIDDYPLDLATTISDSQTQMEQPEHSGFGLLGMQERLTSLGGNLQAGPKPDGGYHLQVWIPFAAPPKSDPEMGIYTNRQAQWSLRSIVSKLFIWFQRHPLTADLGLVIGLVLVGNPGQALSIAPVTPQYDPGRPVRIIATLGITLPLIVRRVRPGICAALVAAAAALLLLFSPWLPEAAICSPIAIYSAVVYGKDTTRRWVPFAVITDVVLWAARCVANNQGCPTVLSYITERPAESPFSASNLTHFTVMAAPALICLLTILIASHQRTRGSVLLLQQERERALSQILQESQALAANQERELIGATMQVEVADTLNTVIASTTKAIGVLNDYQVKGVDPPPEQIAQAFGDIASQGREALARMRQLLTVLRHSSSTDPHSDTETIHDPNKSFHSDGSHKVESTHKTPPLTALHPAKPLPVDLDDQVDNPSQHSQRDKKPMHVQSDTRHEHS
nr:histidine kinase [Bifidobacterium asteroides]